MAAVALKRPERNWCRSILDRVAKKLGKDPELLEAVDHNDNTLSYGAIISVHTDPEGAITALTDDGIHDLKVMLKAARITPETWHAFFDDVAHNTELVARIKAQSPREQPAGCMGCGLTPVIAQATRTVASRCPSHDRATGPHTRGLAPSEGGGAPGLTLLSG